MMKRLAGQRAQGLVEFAVIFPIFAFLLFAVIDGGLLMGRYNNLSNGAKEGARLGAVSVNPGSTAKTNIVQRVKDQAHGVLGSSPSGTCSDMTNNAVSNVVCVEWISGPGGSPAAGQVGSSVRVQVKYKNSFLTPLPNRILTDWFVTECAVQRLEQPITPPAGSTGTGDSC